MLVGYYGLLLRWLFGGLVWLLSFICRIFFSFYFELLCLVRSLEVLHLSFVGALLAVSMVWSSRIGSRYLIGSAGVRHREEVFYVGQVGD